MTNEFTYNDKTLFGRGSLNTTNRGSFVFLILAVIFFLQVSATRAQVCCPEFRLKDAVEICPPEGACQGGTAPGGTHGKGMAACKNTMHQYTVYPNDPAFTYTWIISGGTPLNFTGNPVNILWGSGSVGFIKVLISNLATGGSCRDSIIQQICLIDGPDAGFTATPNPVCANTPVIFTNTSTGGSTYLWDFGDGTTSSLATPPAHVYSIPGTYTVTLTATNAGQGGQGADIRPPCGCADTVQMQIHVLNGTGPVIDTDCCFGTVCPGDTSSLCTSTVCTTYNWSVTGGSIIAGSGTNCIKVKWNGTYTGPTTVSLAVPGCLSAPCPGTTTINVPVLYPSLPVSGPTTLCVGASGSFTLPTMPGTYYLWSTTAPPGTYTFNDQDKNVATVNITFTMAGTYQVQCIYNNPLSGCSGNSTFTVNVLPVFSFSGDETVCEGSTITYVANGNATWTVTPAGATVPGGVSAMANITWNLPGTYIITATPAMSGVFCNLNSIKMVQVIPKPILGNISGPVTVCPGKNYTYAITSNTSGSPFIWTVTGGAGTVMSQMGADQDSAVIRFTNPGPWTVNVYQQIEITPGVYCQSLTQTHSVTAYQPPAISGPATVCVDDVNIYTASGPTPPGGFQWTVTPSNRGSVLSGQGTSSATIRWHGTPTIATVSASHCGGSGSLTVTIVNPPNVAPISANGPTEYCFPSMPNNLTLNTTSGFTSYQWYLNNSLIPGANAFSYTIPNGTFTGAGIYYFSVEVSNGTCTITKTMYILIGDCGGGGNPPNPVICSVDFSINPNPVCADQPATFTVIPTGPGFTYSWNFGDGATSFLPSVEHTYVTPNTYTVTLTATLGSCVAVKTKTITVNPAPVCAITSSDTLFCPGGFVTLTACSGMNSYQWYREGLAVPGATSSTYNAGQHGEYFVEVSNSFGCFEKSNSLYIYMHSLPKAKITGDGSVCAYPGSFTQFNLTADFNSAYKYLWTASTGGVTFTPNNSNSSFFTSVSLTLPGVLPVTYYFMVQVTDTVTGCQNTDTLCVTFFETPPLNFPFYYGCEGPPVTLTPTPVNPLIYDYHWSNGATTPTITVSAPGAYSLTITDKANGCSATALAAIINPLPDLTLFPRGCRTIRCKTDSISMYIPLPLNATGPFSTYPNAYPQITWYDNGNFAQPIATGQNFWFLANGAGIHQLSVVVQNQFGCSDTAGVFCITVDCDTLDFGDAPDNPQMGYLYPTLLSNNGARHGVVPGVFLGSLADTEPNGQPSIGADCDDNDCLYISMGDDEDGVIIPPVVMIGASVNLSVNASVNGFLDAWMDFNCNGSWSDPGEQIFTTFPLSAGVNNLSFTVPATSILGQSYTRFRFQSTGTPVSFNGIAADGEVEDYAVFIEECPHGDEMDFGDDPDNQRLGYQYPTLLASNGARHVMYPNIRLGALIDTESDGQPNLPATGDDLLTSDDEDGVLFTSIMYVGMPAAITVTASISGFLNAWMDFNQNGNWTDPGEQIFINQALAAGPNSLTFVIPATSVPGRTYLRFRFNTTGGLSFGGPAVNGEVEDYRVRSCPNWRYEPTGRIHFITVPSTLSILTEGDVLGVFYTDLSNNLACAGLVEWIGTGTQVMMAYGDDPATPDIKEGFAVGEPIHWYLCSQVKGDSKPIDVEYDPVYPSHDGLFVPNGLSSLTGLVGLQVTASCDPATACPGEPVQLFADVAGGTAGVTFSWFSEPAGFTSGEQNPVAAPTGTTEFIVEAFDGLFYDYDTVKVVVTEINPIVPVLDVMNETVLPLENKCYNATETILVAGGGNTFVVQGGGTVYMIAGHQIRLLPGTRVKPGGFLNAFITSSGLYCCGNPAVAPVKEETMHETITPEAPADPSFFKVYPNPSQGMLTVEFTGSTADAESMSVEMFSLLGEPLFRTLTAASARQTIDIFSWKPGIYFIRVCRGDRSGMTKIIKQ